MSKKLPFKPTSVIVLRASSGEMLCDTAGFYKVYPPMSESCANATLVPIVPGHEWVLRKRPAGKGRGKK